MAAFSVAVNAGPVPVTYPPEFQDLYTRYSDTVYRTALRVTGNPTDAEDVLQTVFLRMWNNRLRIEEERAPDRYFRRAATNAAIDIIRRRSVQAEETIDEGRATVARDSSAYQKQRLREAMATLAPRDSELFVLCYLEGLSYDELADLYGMERGTVGSRLHRIRAALKELLQK